MKDKKFWGSVLAVWVLLFLTDWVFHGMWLKDTYMATQQLWRPEGEMQMHWVWIGNFVFAWTFVWMFSKGISKDSPWHQAFRYGLAILFVAKFPTLMMQWATEPIPTDLIWKWFFVGFVQVLLCSFAVAWFWRKDINWTPGGAHSFAGK